MQRPAAPRRLVTLLIFLLGGQLAGVCRVVEEVAGLDVDGCLTTCDPDDGDGACPPLCPECVCAHRPPIGVAADAGLGLAPSALHRLAMVGIPSTPPGRIAGDSPFRPPRV